jgi:hypothetical protein
MIARVGIILALASTGCSNRREPAPPPAAAPAPVPPDASLLAVHMEDHFIVVAELQRDIAIGRLADAKQRARWLMAHEPPAREGWPMFVEDMQTAAKQVIAAPDLPTASALAARLGRTCSQCHERQAAIVTFAWEPPPADSPDLAAQMRRHQWAAARLWEGLVGPSTEMWDEGASALSTSQLDAAGAANDVPRGDVTALATKIRELSLRATTTDDHDARATLYGEILSTCAGCHELVRPAR